VREMHMELRGLASLHIHENSVVTVQYFIPKDTQRTRLDVTVKLKQKWKINKAKN
jgi:hypothetical protein